MLGKDHQQSQIFSYLSPEARVRNPLRTLRAMVDEVLTRPSRQFDTMYAASRRRDSRLSKICKLCIVFLSVLYFACTMSVATERPDCLGLLRNSPSIQEFFIRRHRSKQRCRAPLTTWLRFVSKRCNDRPE